ncbi:violacein biosynthesis enzyme VioE [Chromobacterium sp. IIBBL 290-4]|uniref:violacein biosynthesis enzyme VioE n=1 Tax=Chromobacterium sp. IIBBL 290-4 TaxID=2953890 RepID=UPI0020B71D84|nr:violacein biosynthesis enzyme VioE [Chromobacterium sp. IIBBL 290-4]UTH74302.1 violacein biosynthesis enzyme VioE [Chromobacterium sp. IIBBL 290-4]
MRNQEPPLLPERWSGAYVSYWSPMQEDDQLTSGFCWFDYGRNICRIDGLFNPWSEEKTGYRLWMSEIGDAARGRTFKRKVAYAREREADGVRLHDALLDDELGPFAELFLPRDLLTRHETEAVEPAVVLGVEAEGWRCARPGKGPITLYFQAGTDRLLRMVTESERGRVSVRDFPNLQTGPIGEEVFQLGG